MRFFSSTTQENEVCRPKSGINLNAGGMTMPGRSYNPSDYKFGYQGSEKVDEISGTGNHITTFYREGDTRLLKWWSVDPITNASMSTYSFMDCNPVLHNDPLGDWVKGAGFFKNVFNSDAKINAQAKATATGGAAFKDGNGWTVHYATNEAADFGNGAVNLKTFNVEHYATKSAGTFVVNVLRGFENALPKGSIENYNANASWEGSTGLKDKGIPMMLGTIGTVVTLGAAAEAGLTGFWAKTMFSASIISNADDLGGLSLNMKNGETPLSTRTPFSPQTINRAKLVVSTASLIGGISQIGINFLKQKPTPLFNTASPYSDAVNIMTQSKSEADFNRAGKK